VKQREAGTPWLARHAADVLAILDMTAWISVLGLLDECPIVPAAPPAMLEHRTTSISPTAFEFIFDNRPDRRHSPLHADASRRVGTLTVSLHVNGNAVGVHRRCSRGDNNGEGASLRLPRSRSDIWIPAKVG